MSRWFRFYDDAVNDPKILKLPDNLFRIWVGILCVASKNDGAIPPLDDLELVLRLKSGKISAALEKLTQSGLIDEVDGVLQPHNWHKRQYRSDVSTERVKRFRNGKRTVSETAPDTEQNRTEQNAVADAPHLTVVATSPPADKLYFDQAVQILGQNGRSLAAKLLKAKDGNVLAAHSALLTAAQKSDPRQYLGAVIAGARDSPVADWRNF